MLCQEINAPVQTAEIVMILAFFLLIHLFLEYVPYPHIPETDLLLEQKQLTLDRAVQDLINAGQKRIVLDGLYSWTEYKILKKAYPTETTVIAIILPRALRHHRVAERPDRPFNAQEINERDWSELENLEKGAPIAIADYYLENSGSISDLHKQLEQLLKDIDFLPKS